MSAKELGELARIVRSKNAGTTLLTLDVIFDDQHAFDQVKRSGAISRKTIASLYKIPPDLIVELVVFEAGLGFKIAFERQSIGGEKGIGDADILGSNQHIPLLNLQIPSAED